MNYTPQTQWVGGVYPGVLPTHLHHVKAEPVVQGRALRPLGRLQASPARNALLAAIKLHGPVSLAQLAEVLGKNTKTMYARILILENMRLVVKESRKNEHSNRRAMYYSGVQ